MKVAIGCDHAGVELKDHLKRHLESIDVEVIDHGTHGSDSVDYPDFGHVVCSEVEADAVDFGILICGSANGMSMTANKHEGIRCALCWLPEIATLAREHNNANVIALPARFISVEDGWQITQAFMKAQFEGGRHQRRVEKIPCA